MNNEWGSYMVYKGANSTGTTGGSQPHTYSQSFISSGGSSGAWGTSELQPQSVQWGYIGVGLIAPQVLDESVEVLIERLRERLQLGPGADALLKSLLITSANVQLDVPPVLETPVRRWVERD